MVKIYKLIQVFNIFVKYKFSERWLIFGLSSVTGICQIFSLAMLSTYK